MAITDNHDGNQTPIADVSGRRMERQPHKTQYRYSETKRNRAIGKLMAITLGALVGLVAMTSPAIAIDNSEPRDSDLTDTTPDLVARSASVTPASATEWEVRLVVANSGDTSAGGFATAIKENGRVLVAQRQTSTLAARASKTHVFRISRSDCYIALRIDVDSGRAVSESNESNNVRWVAGTATGCPGDRDQDGLEDSMEDALASRYFPHVWFDRGENAGCPAPATPTNPGTALARVRPHPSDRTKLAIQYLILYRRDCGDVGGASSHNGDVEPFSLTLAINAACPRGYGVSGLKTIAHAGTSFEHVDERRLGNDCRWGRLAGGSSKVARIYVSENKHGNYASLSSCEAGASHTDHCSEGFTLTYNVQNVGEDNARRIDELSSHQFPGEYAWTERLPTPLGASDVQFTGGLGGNGVPSIRSKWIQDRLLARV